MTDPELSDQQAIELLRKVLRDPFPDPDHLHLLHWFECVSRRHPTWSLQPAAFAALYRKTLQERRWLPFAWRYPLQASIDSICCDDGLDQKEKLVGLERMLDQRRVWLAGDELRQFANEEVWYRDERERFFSSEHEPKFRSVFGVAHPDSIPFPNDVGREFMRLVEARDSAPPGSVERDRGQELVKRFKKDTGLDRRKGKPPEGPPEPIVQALFNEGTEFLDICLQVLPADISEAARQELVEQGVQPSDCSVWAARLALPVLSQREICYVASEAQKTRAAASDPIAAKLTIHILAHRLGMTPKQAVRKAYGRNRGGWAAEYYHDTNPIEDPELDGF